MKIEGSGSESISQRHGSADPDPDTKMSWFRNAAIYQYYREPINTINFNLRYSVFLYSVGPLVKSNNRTETIVCCGNVSSF
jgi:hypothetical protein